MKIAETHHTTITVEPGDKVRDLHAALDEMPNGAEISVYAPPMMYDPLLSQAGVVITVNHLSIEG
ncbi:hypothetical protein ANAYA_58 [Mycobacterium phage Anaya]|uniref:Uncharacterized protein n=1 Tax=Mycobacterium phage Anaya TaxID=2902832 RepID=G1BQ06_9CAUD|nr:hypothetical protein FDI60_gp47 [Mycobacterium phage Anaya]AEK08017.1 hypothetical protein ANAYA_58 [Mycobacterium phage Anaya]